MTKWNEDQEKQIAKFEADMPFTDRETYLQWRADWRADYAALSKEIRELRRNKKRGQASWKGSIAYTQMLIRAASKRKAGKQRAAALAEKVAA